MLITKMQTQVERFLNEWKSERQSETQSQIVMEIYELQLITADELGAKLEPPEKSVNHTIIRTSQLKKI